MTKRIDQLELSPCPLCKGPVEARKLADRVIIRCVAPKPGMFSVGCGLRLERQGTVDEVVGYWEQGRYASPRDGMAAISDD